MKRILSTLFALAAIATTVSAADVTLKGKGTCAKCDLGETSSCQNVVQVTKDGKTTTYYLDGDTSKAFHKNICKGAKEVSVTGTVSTVDGKQHLAVSKIELAK